MLDNPSMLDTRPAQRRFAPQVQAAACLLAVLLAALLALPAGPAQAQAQAQAVAVAPAPPLPWFEGERPGAQALQAVELLSAAASHGLDPRDYDAPALQQTVLAARSGPVAAGAAARLPQALTTSMQRYLGDLRNGRIDPAQVHQRFTPPPRAPYDAAAALQAAFAQRRLAQAVDEAAPQLPQYQLLRQALAQYRLLAEHPAWAQPLPPLPPPGQRGGPAKLERGQPWAGLPVLAARLVALGDLAAAPLAAGASASSAAAGPPALPLYEPALSDAVAAFQERHGLGADGVIGRATLSQLQVTPAARVRQIELTMERLRWTPLTRGPRMIAVNIPEFVLRAYEVVDGRPVVQLQMRVIVGRALNTRTPLFDEDMRFIEFSPYWNVPPSIARKELVPRLRRDPGHFTAEGFEFVSAGGSVDTTLSAARLDAVMAGQSRIRQRPGPKNALGDIKFVFPNSDNIYLHHTPSTSLFERDRRDLSHGCIRVEAPVALAKFVLEGQPEWTEERIRTAMGRGESATLRLAEPLPVVIAYGTSLVKDGHIHFFDDIYGHDRLLDAALRKRSSERQGPGVRP
jgi:murein L,D-transpeptidase YcbB/YkuD